MSADRYNHGFLTTTSKEIMRGRTETVVVTSMWFCNTSGSNSTFDLHHVPADEEDSNQFALFYNNVLRSKVTTVIDTPIFIRPGETLYAQAGAASAVTATLYVISYGDWLRSSG